MRRSGILRLIAGAYLLYLSYKILTGGVIGGGMQGNTRIFGLVAGIVFIAAGGYALVSGLRSMLAMTMPDQEEIVDAEGEVTGEADVPEEETGEPDEPCEPDEVPGPRSLFDRAMRTSDIDLYGDEDEYDDDIES